MRLLFFIVSVGLPVGASTGVFSFVSGFADAARTHAKEVVYNAQNLPLLKAAVHSDPNPAKGGGDLNVVDGAALLAERGPEGRATNEDTKLSPDQISIYVVREGDSLSQIAEMFGVSSNTIIWANDLKKGTAIRPGDTLVILPISGVRHTVAKGDTIQSIAKKYHGDPDEILQFNDLSSQTLAVGEVLLIPDGEIAAPPASKPNLIRGGGPSIAGFLIRPISGGVRTQGLHGYNGVDLASPIGTQIVASAAGVVVVSRNSGWNAGYGNYVVIKHPNGVQTLYAHMRETIVGVGQEVVQGQVIGYIGVTGKTTGPHVHFEVRGAANPF